MNNAINATHLTFLLTGAFWTLVLSLMAFVGGGVVGLVIALGRTSPVRFLRILSGGYVQIVQGTPLLVILFVVYFGLPTVGYSLSPMLAAGLSLTIYVSAYLGEIWRGCLEAVPKAQWEAAECLALSKTQRMVKVILPQAVRIATPPTVGF